jgi:hypothetical protein
MPDDRRDYDKEYETLMQALADSVLKESSEELVNDLRAEGIDPGAYAENLRKVMLDSVKAHKQQALIKARRSHKDSVAAYEQRKVHLPSTPARRRAALERVLQRDPSVRQLTLQNREFTELTDEDIESYLQQLHALNAIDENDLKDE